MLSNVFNFLISIISKSVEWLFTIQVNDSPKITLGMFLIGCAFIGYVIKFILGTDFVPLNIFNHNSGGSSNDSYQPKHVSGMKKVMPTDRVSKNFNKY